MLIFIGLGFGHRRVHFLRVLKGLVFDGGWLFDVDRALVIWPIRSRSLCRLSHPNEMGISYSVVGCESVRLSG